MPQLFARLHRRFAGSTGITRREMIQRSLAAAAGVLLSERLRARRRPGQAGPRRGHRRRLQRPGGRLRAVTRGLRRHRRRGAQPRRRARPQLLRSGAGQERRGRRRADRIQSPDVGRVREAVQARVPRRDRGGRRSADRARRQAAVGRSGSEALWEELEKTSNLHERRCREDHRSVRAVAVAERRGARQAHAGVLDRRARCVAALQGGARRDDDRRQRR